MPALPTTNRRLLQLMLDILRDGPARTPSLHEVESADAVFVLGEDVTNVAPRMALACGSRCASSRWRSPSELHIPLWMDHAVREAVQDEKGPLFIASTGATRLDDIATARIAPRPTIWRGLASRWRMRSTHVRPRRQTLPKQCWRWRRRSPRR